MKKYLLLAVLPVAVIALASASFMMQDKRAGQVAVSVARPGPEQAQLSKRVGNWTTTTQVILGAAKPAMQTLGTAKITSILDGLFIREEFSGQMMGQTYDSTRITGYNRGSMHYESVWAYTLGTGLMNASGTSKDNGKTIQCTGTWDNDLGVRETMQILTQTIDDDHFSVTSSGTYADGSAMPTMVTTYTRSM